MNFVFDQLPDDSRQAIDAAAVMGMREIDFFRLAFRRWDGREIESNHLERVFAGYMFHDETPHWVRHFAREVMELRDAGALNPSHLGAEDYRPRETLPRRPRLTVGFVVVVVLAYSFALVETTYYPGDSPPMHCQGGPGFKFFTEIAHAVNGKQPGLCDSSRRQP